MSILDESAVAAGNITNPITNFLKNPFKKDIVNKSRPQDFSRGFVMIEYVDGKYQTDTAIFLAGNMMPMRPFPWDNEQRLVTEYYPGNPEPSVHVLGDKQGNITINGRFKDKRLRDPNLYGAAYEYALAVDEMRKRGNLIFFGFQGVKDWTRHGFIEKTAFKMDKLSWVNYEISFVIVSENLPVNNFFAEDSKTDPSKVNQALIDAVGAFNTTYSSVLTTMPQSFGDVINGVINGVAQNIKLVTNFVDTVIGTVSSIEQGGFRALGLIKNARTSISVYRRQLGKLGFGSGASTDQSVVGNFTHAQTNIAYIGNIRSALSDLSLQLAQSQHQFEKISKTIPITRYRVQDKDTLQNIAIKFYGAQDNWSKIYDHNKLTSTALVPGTILEIPKV